MQSAESRDEEKTLCDLRFPSPSQPACALQQEESRFVAEGIIVTIERRRGRTFGIFRFFVGLYPKIREIRQKIRDHGWNEVAFFSCEEVPVVVHSTEFLKQRTPISEILSPEKGDDKFNTPSRKVFIMPVKKSSKSQGQNSRCDGQKSKCDGRKISDLTKKIKPQKPLK